MGKKKENFIGYLKCVKANKATLFGYISVASPLILIPLNKITPLANISMYEALGITIGTLSLELLGTILLHSTAYGTDTFNTYRRSKKQIQEYKEKIKRQGIDRFGKKHCTYCDIQGHKLAMSEAGLEKLV